MQPNAIPFIQWFIDIFHQLFPLDRGAVTIAINVRLVKFNSASNYWTILSHKNTAASLPFTRLRHLLLGLEAPAVLLSLPLLGLEAPQLDIRPFIETWLGLPAPAVAPKPPSATGARSPSSGQRTNCRHKNWPCTVTQTS